MSKFEKVTYGMTNRQVRGITFCALAMTVGGVWGAFEAQNVIAEVIVYFMAVSGLAGLVWLGVSGYRNGIAADSLCMEKSVADWVRSAPSEEVRQERRAQWAELGTSRLFSQAGLSMEHPRTNVEGTIMLPGGAVDVNGNAYGVSEYFNPVESPSGDYWTSATENYSSPFSSSGSSSD